MTEGVAMVVPWGVPTNPCVAAHITAQRIPEVGEPKGGKEVQEAFAITFGSAEHGEGFLAPTACGQSELRVARVGDEHLGDRREEGLEPVCNRHAFNVNVKERRVLERVVAQEEATSRRVRGEATVGRLGFKEGVNQSRGRCDGNQSQCGVVKGFVKGKMVATKTLEEGREIVLNVMK